MTSPICFASVTGNPAQPLTALDDLVANPATAGGYIKSLRDAAFSAGFADSQICYPLWAGWRSGQKTWPARQWTAMPPHLRTFARSGVLPPCNSICVGAYTTPGETGNWVDENNKQPVDAATDAGRLIIETEWATNALAMHARYIVIDKGNELPNLDAMAHALMCYGLTPILNGLPLVTTGHRPDGSPIWFLKYSPFQSLTLYTEEMKRIDPERSLRVPVGHPACHVIIHPDIPDDELASLKARGFTVGTFVEPNNIAEMKRVIQP